MKKSLLFSGLLVSIVSFAQDDNHQRVKAELVEWDAVRGEWLAESFNAMANDKPIPDRTFPEDITPAEMYSMVPVDRQERIRTIVNQPASPNNRTPQTPQTGQNRVPVGGGSTNRPEDRSNRYNSYVSRSGCDLVMGRTYGDPHIRTFDGKSYSFQTVGEYVLTSSPDRRFEVQTRQRPQTNDVSLNTAVAMNVYGDRVGIYASDSPDGNGATPVRVNGRPIYVNNETFYLPHGGTIQNNGREYVVTWPTGEKVQAKISSTSGMRFMNVSVFVYQCNGNYFGLMGNANGRSDDDFSGENSRVNLASSTIFEPFGSRDFGRSTSAMEREHLAFLARDFGNQFLVNDQTSLFDYGFGQSSWTFYDPSFPRTHLTMGDLTQVDRDRARRECERQGILADDMNGCVMDLAHANIDPTPRSSTPDRTSGRDLTPVSERKPNVNRPDVFDRIPTPTTGGSRTPSTNSDVNGVIEESNKDKGSVSKPDVRPLATGSIEESNSGNKKPSFEGASATKTSGIERDVDGGVSGTIKTEEKVNNPGVVRKPIETSQPAEKRPSTVTNNPTSTTKPVDKPVERPAPTKPSTSSGTVSKPSTTKETTVTSTPSTVRSSPSTGGASKVVTPSSSSSKPISEPKTMESKPAGTIKPGR